LPTTAPDAAISAVSTSIDGEAAEPCRPAVGHDPESAELHHRGQGCIGELRAMTKIDIFTENHRSSN
jgi:hypothetical protein